MSYPSLSRAKWLRDPQLQRLFAVLATEGEVRVVGGAVRNALMKLPVRDVDVATNLLPQVVARLSKATGFRVHPTGIEHGTLTIVVEGKPFEVTTLRQDVKTDGRRAVVTFTKDWATDAKRRDFTINALYADENGKVYDYTDGWDDVRKHRVRFIGSTEARIREDYLRILRFFRFHAQFGKGVPDAKGLAACKRLAQGLDRLSAERIWQELSKLLAAPGAVPALKAMAKCNVLQHVVPYFENWRVLQRLPADAVLRLFALAKSPAELKERFRLSNSDANRIRALLDAPSLSPKLATRERNRILYHIGEGTWHDAVLLAWATSKAPLNDRSWKTLLACPKRFKRPVMPVSGGDLINKGVAPGPRLGQALRDLEDRWMANDFKPDRETLLAHFGNKT
jgi:poly(A) polymerase